MLPIKGISKSGNINMDLEKKKSLEDAEKASTKEEIDDILDKIFSEFCIGK